LGRQEEYLADPWNFRAPGGESEKEVEERMHAFFDSAVLPVYQQFCETQERREKEAALNGEVSKQGQLTVAIFSHGCGLRYNFAASPLGPIRADSPPIPFLAGVSFVVC
jgi:hypothetical protein